MNNLNANLSSVSNIQQTQTDLNMLSVLFYLSATFDVNHEIIIKNYMDQYNVSKKDAIDFLYISFKYKTLILM